MPTHVDTLLRVSSNSIVSHPPIATDLLAYVERWGQRGKELAELLTIRNGFFAYDSSLLVRPFERSDAPVGIVEWNQSSLWKCAYHVALSHVLCFAEDVFGGQHCLRDDAVSYFEPETGECEDFAPTLYEWARVVTSDSEYRTGCRIAQAWQAEHHPLPRGMRLLPKFPFVLGGNYETSNLYAIGDVEGMTFRGSLANQIRDVSDGEQIILEFEKKSND